MHGVIRFDVRSYLHVQESAETLVLQPDILL